MYKFLFLFLGVINISMSVAQTISLSGKVSNASGQAISGAVVELINQGLKDTTGADGMYAFNGTVDVIHSNAVGESMVMTGGLLKIRLDASAPIDIKVFDVHGSLLKHNTVRSASAGLHVWNFEKDLLQTGIMIIQARAAAKTRTFRYVPLELSGSSSHLVTNATPLVEARFSKMTAAAVDSLRVTAAGYPVTTMEVSSYSATVNVTLSGGSADKWGGLKNPPAKSSGCGSPQGITSGRKTINSGGQNREYIIDIPSNYDPDKPYRFFYVSHWVGGTAQSMANNNYYAIKNEANGAGEPAIFVAASGINGFWGEADHPLFDNILAHVEENLCIDTTRVFAIGYSFGGMISYSLSTNHQHKIRAVVGIAPANYNIWIPNPKIDESIPWLQIHGLRDETCRWVNNESQKTGGKFIVLEKAEVNGCDIPSGGNFPVWQSGPHFCYEFEGCDEGYPVKICTNNETHSGAEKYRDSGQSSSWVPPTAWEFFTRF